MEFRGGLDDFCACAARALCDGGTFAFVMAAQDARCETAPAKHGFGVVRRIDVVFKAGRKPHICVCVCARLGEARLSHPRTETLVLRDSDGKRTRAYRIWQERSRDRAALVAAGANAEALGVRADPGSEELCAAKARLAGLV